uniref:centromere protein K isoform X3 n=1 Tax=Jaculus jaculus TaxID=51337 RepID=UPI001E1AF4C3|nr:centromere protein K isoform X3 [Jaculus jaculus]
MSVVQQDLDLDSSEGVEVSVDTEEELMKECEEMWDDMEKCQNKLSLFGTETLTNSNAQFQKLRQDLEMVLTTLQSKNEKLKEDLEREQQWLNEQEQIMESLNLLHGELKNQVGTCSESRILNELKTKIISIKKFKEKILITLGKFLEDHFPLPHGNIKKKRKNIQESTAQLITLNEILEILINRMFDVPHDPYVKINDCFWPPYIELILRNGIALRHPEDPTQIRLEAFHQ